MCAWTQDRFCRHAPQIVERGVLGTRLIVEATADKHIEHLPIERQCLRYHRTGVDIAPQPLGRRFLGDKTKRTVQSDGTNVLTFIERDGGKRAGYARRGFVEAARSGDKLALEALQIISGLFAVEKASRQAGDNSEQRKLRRAEHSQPIVAEIQCWGEEQRAVTIPGTALGKSSRLRPPPVATSDSVSRRRQYRIDQQSPLCRARHSRREREAQADEMSVQRSNSRRPLTTRAIPNATRAPKHFRC